MNRLCTPQPYFDPLISVIGIHGTAYACPDLATVDAHIASLWHRIALAAGRFPTLESDFLFEIDLLLDRRRWVEIEAAFEGPLAA